MANDTNPIKDYCKEIENTLAAGHASEGSHYPALQKLIQALGDNIVATILPKQIECGAPDFLVTKGSINIGYIEAKDIGKSLDETEKTEQLKRYRDSLPNLILTDYLEFRWYVDGECRLSVSLGGLTEKHKIKQDKDGAQAVIGLVTDFLKHDTEGVGTPKELARRMARLAHRIREGVEESFEKGIASDLLNGLYKAFEETLIPGLEIKVFADMYAQTIAYGLFAARCETDNPADFSRQKAASLISKTNPFLRDLFYQITGPDLDEEPYKWAVDELVQLLKKAEMTEIVIGLSKGTGRDDPVVYFYEDFLRAYDKKISEMRGVYYTPIPVVSYIVRSIDYLLKNTFKRPQGLADEETYILDPATGTGTFLYAVINEIYEYMNKQGQTGQWDGYVTDHLLPRIFGFELLMTPYVIAHLKLGLQLKDTGYQFQANKRLGVYLTNTLEEAVKSTEMLMAQYIVKEANAAAEIKKKEKIMVVLGNPPYSLSSLNRGEWIGTLLEDYKKGLHEKKINIDDDYIKFIRFSQWRIEQTGYGILGFITNSSYLDGLTHRRMRECLLDGFSEIYILNLHGSSRRGEQAPGNIKDENVFDIQQGVAIGIFVKELKHKGEKHVYYADMWGARESKYKALFEGDVESTGWEELKPTEPYFFFVPKDFSLKNEYEQMPSATRIFSVWQSALNTDRDELFLDSDDNELHKRLQLLFNKNYDDNFKEKYRIYPSSSYDIEARRDRTKFAKVNIQRCLHRPFDECFVYYDPQLTSRPVYEVMRHMLQNNIALICARQTKEDFAVLATSALCTHKIVTVYDRSFVFPLYLYPTEGEMPLGEGRRRPNLNPEFIKAMGERLGMRFEPHPLTPSPPAERGTGGEVVMPHTPSNERGTGGGVVNPQIPSLQAEREHKGEVVTGSEVATWRTPPDLWAQLKPIARQMRKEPTEAENRVWQCIRKHRLLGFKFRRQHSIERFIVDFYCSEASLVVEIDGPVHQYQQEEDSIRQAFLESQGFRVLRFSNDEVKHNIDDVLKQISDDLSPPSPQAEREHKGEVVIPDSPLPSPERGTGVEVFTPEDILNYAYAVFHSPTYRTRYAEFLKIDFPRLPLTSNKQLFRALAEKGAELVSLHLMESPALNTLITKYPFAGTNTVDKVIYDEKNQRVYINKEQYFEGVPAEVWNFHIGGYQVCQKWLKDRKGRTLTYDDKAHYQKIIVALKETIRLMAEIDALIPGWPIT